MVTLIWLVVVLAIFNTAECKGKFERNRLEVTFGTFSQYPLTSTEAKNKGWRIDASCKDPKPHSFNGYRYVKDDDNTTRILFDCRGRIAGIQATLTPPSSYPTEFNSEPWVKNPDGTISATAYFRDPKLICSCKRHCDSGSRSLVGDRLWIQQGDIKDNKFMELPLNKVQTVNTPWVEGNCFPFMGVHYHYNISKSFDCRYAQPVFLIASKQTGDVHGFGWGVPFLVKSNKWEKPSPDLFAKWIKSTNLPECIKKQKLVGCQHFYFVDHLNIAPCY